MGISRIKFVLVYQTGFLRGPILRGCLRASGRWGGEFGKGEGELGARADRRET